MTLSKSTSGTQDLNTGFRRVDGQRILQGRFVAMRGLLSVLLLLCLTRQAATFSPILGATRAALPHRLCASPRLGLRLARCSAGAELGDIVQRAALRRAEAAEILPALEELLATKPQVVARPLPRGQPSLRTHPRSTRWKAPVSGGNCGTWQDPLEVVSRGGLFLH